MKRLHDLGILGLILGCGCAGKTASMQSISDAAPDDVPLSTPSDASQRDAAAGEDGDAGPPFVDLPAQAAVFPFFILDAEYDRATDRTVLLTDDPPGLHVYEPEKRADAVVPLPFRPFTLSIGYDGHYAAVGEYPGAASTKARIAFIDLRTLDIVKVCSIEMSIADIVLGPGDIAYAFPEYSGEAFIHSIRLSDCGENDAPRRASANSTGRLAPDGTAVYLSDRGAPSNISTVVQTTVLPTWFADNRVIESCEQFWLTDDAKRLITACGNVYGEGTNHEPVRLGALEGYPKNDRRLLSFVHSATTHRFATIGSTGLLGDSNLRIYRDADLRLEKDVSLPVFRGVEGGTGSAFGKIVMQKNDGSKYYVLAGYQNPVTLSYVGALVSVDP